MNQTDRVVELIRTVGVRELGLLDGCICCRFSVRNVEVDISCGKGADREIIVGSRSLLYEDDAELRPVLEEVERQAIALNDRRGPFKLTVIRS